LIHRFDIFRLYRSIQQKMIVTMSLSKTIQKAAKLIGLAFSGVTLAASAQTRCIHLGDTTVCQGPEGGSTLSRTGDVTLVTRDDGSSATMVRIGDSTLINDSREGKSGSAHHIGDVMIIRIGAITSVCVTAGASTLCS
jgi:hypothetical protein